MRARALFMLSSFSFSLLLSAPAAACSICGCDPSSGALGLDRPSAQTLRLLVEDRMLAKESGQGDAAESERENRAQLRLQYSPIARLTTPLGSPGPRSRARGSTTSSSSTRSALLSCPLRSSTISTTSSARSALGRTRSLASRPDADLGLA